MSFQGGFYKGFLRLRSDSTTSAASPADWQEGFPIYLQGSFPRPSGIVETDTTGSYSGSVLKLTDSTGSYSGSLFKTSDSTGTWSAAPTTFHPNDINTARDFLDRASLWLAADHLTGTYVDDDSVEWWPDALGLQADFFGVGSPTFKENIINGLPAIYLNGSSRLDSTCVALWNYGITIFAVFKQDSGGGASEAIISESLKTFGDEWGLSVSDFWIYDSGIESIEYTCPTDTWTFVTGYYNANTALKVHRDSTAWNVGSFPQTISVSDNTVTKTTIGKAGNITNSDFSGYIAEILTYDGELTYDESQLVLDYLINKYNFPAETDSTGSYSADVLAAYDSTGSYSGSILERYDSTGSYSTSLTGVIDSTGSYSASTLSIYDSTASWSGSIFKTSDSTATYSASIRKPTDTTGSYSGNILRRFDTTGSYSGVLIAPNRDTTASYSGAIFYSDIDSTGSYSGSLLLESDSTGSYSGSIFQSSDSTGSYSMLVIGAFDTTASYSAFLFIEGAWDTTGSYSASIGATYDSTGSYSTYVTAGEVLAYLYYDKIYVQITDPVASKPLFSQKVINSNVTYWSYKAYIYMKTYHVEVYID